jgi:hypothetical protein
MLIRRLSLLEGLILNKGKTKSGADFEFGRKFEPLEGLRELTKVREVELLQLLNAYLLDLWLPDLVRHPFWRIGRLIDLNARSLKHVYLFRAALPKPDICDAPVRRLQCRLPWRFACKDRALFAFFISQDEVSGFLLFFLGYDDSSHIMMKV